MMWTLVEESLDRSERQKPKRTSPLVNVPRNPIEARTELSGSKETVLLEIDSDDVVTPSVLYPSVWNSEDISSGQSTVDNIANPVLSISEVAAVSFHCIILSYSTLFSLART